MRLRQGRLEAEHLAVAARALAAMHDGARCDDAKGEAGAAALAQRVRDCAAAIERAGCDPAAPVERTLRAVAVGAELLAARARDGRVVRTRGPIGLANLYVDSQLRALVDPPAHAVERVADGAEAVARLGVGLVAAGRRDLAERFVAQYAEASGDFDLYRLLALYEGIAVLSHAEEAALAGDAGAAGRFLELARPSAPAQRPRLVGVCGPPASGVSTVARRLAAEIGAPVVSAHGLREPGVPRGGFSLYLALARRAEAVLDSGRSVVLEGGLGSQAARKAAMRLARERGLPFLLTECRADESLRQRRLAAAPPGPAPFEDEWEPVSELAGASHVVIDTGRTIARSLARLRRALPAARPLVA